MSADDRVSLGVALLEHMEADEVALPTAIDRLETVSSDPAIIRAIVDEADRQGLVDREAGVVRPTGGSFVRFESQVITREGDFACRRCGTSLETGYFIQLEPGEVGPFGSSCIRKVTGRE
ncbi:MAG: DUF5830 family protein [Natrialbaceae archaeon]|nr:DUF5830 family protein [Natrialbaceae archaeon]